VADVPLADAITNLRHELQRAIARGADEQLQFELDSVVVELNVAFSTVGRADAKAGLWTVVSAGASAEHSRQSTHRLTLTLAPRLADAPGQKVKIGDQVAEPPPAVPFGS
jgi:hypothetical protein